MRKPLLFHRVSTLQRNSKLTIFLQLFWAVPFFLYNSFASLYMMQIGLTPTQIGIINSVSFLAKTVIAVFAGTIINFLGRKASVVIFDALSWLVPLFLWAVADNFWYFFFAGLINSVVIVNGLAVSFYLIENNDSGERLVCLTFMDIINVTAGLLVPLMSLLIQRYTLVPTMRGIYFFGFGCMLILIATKATFLTETPVGEKLKGKVGDMKGIWGDMKKSLLYIVTRHRLLALLIAKILVSFGLVINGLFLFPFLIGHIGMEEKSVSVFPFVSSLVTALALLFVNSRVKKTVKFLGMGLLLHIGSAVLLLLAPRITAGNSALLTIVILAAYLLLAAAAKAIVNPFFSLVIANEIDDDLRANIMGFDSMMSTLCVFPAGILGGMVYEKGPSVIFILITLIFVIAGFVYFLGAMPKKEMQTK